MDSGFKMPMPTVSIPHSDSNGKSKGRILVVDDSEMHLWNISTHLKKAGYETLEAVDGRKALALAQKEKPDVIISDYFMPEFNGMQLGKAIKSDPETSHIYFLMLTANEKTVDRNIALNSFADDYLQKPISPGELLAKVNSIMRLARLQRELKDRNAQLESTNRELKKAYKELKDAHAQMLQQEKMASIGLLAAGVAHEINNPICFVDMNLGMMLEYLQPIEKAFRKMDEIIAELPAKMPPSLTQKVEDLRNFIADADLKYLISDMKSMVSESREGSERVKEIVQTLRDFSHVDQQERKCANIHFGLESTLNIVWNEIKYKATVTKEFGEIPEIYCYPRQLNQVFLNILVNAAHAIEEKGEIKIKTWHDQKWVYIAISDTGQGIPKQNLNKIFEPFFTTKPAGKGTGLGLAMSYNIIKKHDGDIEVQSEVGKGTTFTIKLPINAKPKCDKDHTNKE